jgi:tripartite-type tricarboxylate transporter receptor subunit TctC
MNSAIRAALLAACALAAAPAAAQTYPAKPIRIVVPFPAGGPTDIVARLVAVTLGEVMGQTVVVENRAGANGLIGVDSVVKSAPDGYTMTMTTASPVAISPAVYPKMPFDTVRDLAAVTLATTTPELLVVHPSVPARSMKELIALAKARPGDLNIASTGSGSLPHLAMELLKVAGRVDVTHVPYNGAAPAVTALVGGQVHGMFADLPVLLPYVQGGRLRALGMASPKRATLLPDLPTMSEQGLASVEAVNWYGVLVPAATPREIVARLNEGFRKALADGALREKLAARGADPVANTPEQFAAYLKQDIARWAKLAQTTSIKVD